MGMVVRGASVLLLHEAIRVHDYMTKVSHTSPTNRGYHRRLETRQGKKESMVCLHATSKVGRH